MRKFKTLVSTVILGILLYPSVWADHLKGKSKQELDRFLIIVGNHRFHQHQNLYLE